MIYSTTPKRLICATFVVMFAVAIEGVPAECPFKRPGAISTNSKGCAEIAMDMLEKKGGTAADAAIAAMLCEGVLSPHTTGISGGFIATIYNKAKNTVRSLIARDCAPIRAHKDMYNDIKKVEGGIAVSVPGEIKGYFALHREYGKLPWNVIFEPIIELAQSYKVSAFLANNIQQKEVQEKMRKFPSLKAFLTNPKTGQDFKEGETMERPKLAATLKEIRDHGENTMYTTGGKLANDFVNEIKELGGIITLEDMAQYKVRWEDPLSLDLKNGKMLYTAPTPGSGALLIFILSVLRGHLEKNGKNDPQSYHRIAEAFKFAYAKRGDIADAKFEGVDTTDEGRKLKADVNAALNLLRNEKFINQVWQKIQDHPKTSNNVSYYDIKSYTPNDHGTANMNIIAPNGDAIAVTASINTLFGSGEVGKYTGVVFNDGMDDFAIPGRPNAYKVEPSPVNFIYPHKMPLSSMCPTLLLDKATNQVVLATGAAGGSRITTAVAYVLSRYLYFGESIKDAVEAPRIHHQLLPMELMYDNGKPGKPGFSQTLIDGLKALGHKVTFQEADAGFGALTAVGYTGDQLVPVYDPRRNGSASRDIFSYRSAADALKNDFCKFDVELQEGKL